MPFLAVGVEHRTTPLAVRESVAMDLETIAQVATDLHRSDAIDEVVVLSTCNRTEIYLSTNDLALAAAEVAALLAARDQRVAATVQTWEEMEAIRHLFRVASGLESQVLGEEQVLGQVREAMEAAQQQGAIGPALHAAFRAAISCARQARAATALGRVDASFGAEAIALAERELGSLAGRSALVIGGGEISRQVVRMLRARDVGSLYIANRTQSVAIEIAEAHRGHPVPLDQIGRVLGSVDLAVSATSAPAYVVTPEDVAGRAGRSLHVYDLAIPRDVDPAVGDLPGVVLHDLDALLPAGVEEHWHEDVRAMEGIINGELQEFRAAHLTRRVAPIIASLRSHVETVSEQELRRVAPKLKDLTPREREAVESLTNRLIDKMFHHLVMRLRFAAQTDESLVEAAEFFFLHGEGGLFEHAHHQATDRLSAAVREDGE